MRFIIAIQKKLGLYGHVVRGFKYDVKHNLHIWQGKEFEAEEFNAISKDVFHEQASLHPFALVVMAPPTDEGKEIARLKANLAQAQAEVDRLNSALTPAIEVPASARSKVGRRQRAAVGEEVEA